MSHLCSQFLPLPLTLPLKEVPYLSRLTHKPAFQQTPVWPNILELTMVGCKKSYTQEERRHTCKFPVLPKLDVLVSLPFLIPLPSSFSSFFLVIPFCLSHPPSYIFLFTFWFLFHFVPFFRRKFHVVHIISPNCQVG